VCPPICPPFRPSYQSGTTPVLPGRNPIPVSNTVFFSWSEKFCFSNRLRYLTSNKTRYILTVLTRRCTLQQSLFFTLSIIMMNILMFALLQGSVVSFSPLLSSKRTTSFSRTSLSMIGVKGRYEWYRKYLMIIYIFSCMMPCVI